ncbi:MAG: hypothetical protein AAF694_14760 [Bacteroidota bacterium]
MQRYTWIYSLSQPTTAEQTAYLKQSFGEFLGKWNSHGTPVAGEITLAYQRFVIIQANPGEDRPSGCSIDGLKRTVEGILQQKGLTWVEASQVFFKDPEEQIQSIDFRALPTFIQQGKLKSETKVFDHTLNQSDDLSKWEVPLKETWMKRFLPKASLES